MARETTSIGELLANISPDPYSVRNVAVEVIHPDYKDEHFSRGFALRTVQQMSREQVLWLLALDTQSRGGGGTLKRLVGDFGALQMQCPDMRSGEPSHGFASFLRSEITPLHKDSFIYEPSDPTLTLALAVAPGMPLQGSTLVIPDALALRLLCDHGRTIGFPAEDAIDPPYVLRAGRSNRMESPLSVQAALEERIDVYQSRYWTWWKSVLQEAERRFVRSTEDQRRTFTQSIEGSAHVLAHDWDAFEVLGHSDRFAVHGSGVHSGGTFLSRSLP